MGLDFIMIVTILLSHCGFCFVFGRGVSFLGGFQSPLADGCSTASCDFGALGGDEGTSSMILNWKSTSGFNLLCEFPNDALVPH